MRKFLIAATLLSASSHTFADNLVTNGDFSNGNTGFTSAYDFEDPTNDHRDANPSYAIASHPSDAVFSWYDWADYGDHTDRSGQMFVANGNTDSGTPTSLYAWSQTVTVAENSVYDISYFVSQIDAFGSQAAANLQFYVNGVAVDQPALTTQLAGEWVKGTGTWNSGNATTAMLGIADLTGGTAYNDFALDDISFTSATPPVPEPGEWGMMLVGLAVAGLRRGAAQRRRLRVERRLN